jgi:hypothetical protein
MVAGSNAHPSINRSYRPGSAAALQSKRSSPATTSAATSAIERPRSTAYAASSTSASSLDTRGNVAHHSKTKVGYDYIHSAIDAHSRLAYSEALPRAG